MIIFDLKCSHGHVFEAWFGSSSDYEDQKARGLLSCPICGDGEIGKAVMAPAVPAKSNTRSDDRPAPTGHAVPMQTMPDPAAMREMMAKIATAQAEALKNSEWVGRNFAEKARAMHYGEADHQSIHGEVAPEEARSLVEEGVPVAPLLVPVVPPESRN